MTKSGLSELSVQELVERTLRDSDDAARSEVERRGAEAVPALLAALADPSRSDRWWIVSALGKAGDPSAVEPLVGVLAGADPELARWAASALGELRDARAVEPLIAALRHPDGEVREHAIFSLLFLEDRRAARPLCDVLLQDSSWYARCKAADALGRLADPLAVPALVRSLEYDKEHWALLAASASEALAEIDAPLSLAPMIAALARGPEPSEAERLIESLTALARHDQASLVRGLESPLSLVRAGCAGALKNAGDAGCVQPLLRLVDDPARPVRGMARSTLKAMRKRGVAVDLPSRSVSDRLEAGLGWLMENYFVAPSGEGFSPYRTGAATHAIFSVLVCMAVTLLALRLGASFAAALMIAAACVFALWGAGVWIGVLSHYNPFITLAALAALVLLARMLKGLASVWVVGLLAHGASWAAVRLLSAGLARWRKREP